MINLSLWICSSLQTYSFPNLLANSSNFDLKSISPILNSRENSDLVNLLLQKLNLQRNNIILRISSICYGLFLSIKWSFGLKLNIDTHILGMQVILRQLGDCNIRRSIEEAILSCYGN